MGTYFIFRNRSFTLMEVLIVLIIASVIVGLAYVKVFNMMETQQCINAKLRLAALGGKLKTCFSKKGENCPGHGYIDELADEFNDGTAGYYYTVSAACDPICSFEARASKIHHPSHFLYLSCEATRTIRLEDIFCVKCPKACAINTKKPHEPQGPKDNEPQGPK